MTKILLFQMIDARGFRTVTEMHQFTLGNDATLQCLETYERVWFAEICKGECVEHIWAILGDEFVPPLREAVEDYDGHIRKLCSYARTAVAFVGPEISGAVSYCANDSQFCTGFVSEIAVSQKFRGMGIGKKLMRQAMDEAAKAGMTSIRLEVRKDNIGASRLYESLGFDIELERSVLSWCMKSSLPPVGRSSCH